MGTYIWIVFPKRCCVSCWLNCAIGSRYAAAAGDINAIKSSSVLLCLANAASTSAGVLLYMRSLTSFQLYRSNMLIKLSMVLI
jgi:hypothetical protein